MTNKTAWREWRELLLKLLQSGESPEKLKEEMLRAQYEAECAANGVKP